MKKDFIETLRINTLSTIPPYDRKYQDEHCYISIGHVNNRYGILNEDGTEFLPFEYDNITVWGFGLLQTSLNGKLGLLHIKQKNKGCDFYIAKQIACEYDVIDGRHEGVVFLRNYNMRTDSCDGRSVRAYLTKPEVLTDKFVVEMILSTEYKRGLLSLEGDRDIILSTETGETLVEMEDGFTLGAYDTAKATIVQQVHNGGSRLLYIGKDEIKEYVFGGMNAYAVTGLDADGEPQTVGFIVEATHGFKLLDEELRPLSHGAFPRVEVRSEITAYSHDGDAVIFPLRKQRLRLGDIEIH